MEQLRRMIVRLYPKPSQFDAEWACRFPDVATRIANAPEDNLQYGDLISLSECSFSTAIYYLPRMFEYCHNKEPEYGQVASILAMHVGDHREELLQVGLLDVAVAATECLLYKWLSVFAAFPSSLWPTGVLARALDRVEGTEEIEDLLRWLHYLDVRGVTAKETVGFTVLGTCLNDRVDTDTSAQLLHMLFRTVKGESRADVPSQMMLLQMQLGSRRKMQQHWERAYAHMGKECGQEYVWEVSLALGLHSPNDGMLGT